MIQSFSCEHMKLYRSFVVRSSLFSYTVALDKAAIKREGSDVTTLLTGYMVHESLLAADELVKEGIEAEVLDCVQFPLMKQRS